jgi:integrase
MSSIHRQPGKPNWFCAFYDWDAEGKPKRRLKTTGTANRKQAEIICEAMQKAARKARAGKLTPDHARAIIEQHVSEIAEAHGIEMPRQSIKDHFQNWLKSKGCTDSTRVRYQNVLDLFFTHLGSKSKHSLQALTDHDVLTFRDKFDGKVSAGTINFYLKVIRGALNSAVKKNLISRSPAISVEKVQGKKHKRKPFTLAQLQKIMAAATDDLKTSTMLGLYTGLRLSDVAGLTWANLDLQKSEITTTEKKTGNTRTLQIAKPLLRYLEKLPADDNPVAPLCPSLHGKPAGWLSTQFYDLLASVGLVEARDHQSKNKGRSSIRQQNAYTFHSLRHTTANFLKNSGASNTTSMAILGHENEEVHQLYGDVESDTIRKALNKLPDITK